MTEINRKLLFLIYLLLSNRFLPYHVIFIKCELKGKFSIVTLWPHFNCIVSVTKCCEEALIPFLIAVAKTFKQCNINKLPICKLLLLEICRFCMKLMFANLQLCRKKVLTKSKIVLAEVTFYHEQQDKILSRLFIFIEYFDILMFRETLLLQKNCQHY